MGILVGSMYELIKNTYKLVKKIHKKRRPEWPRNHEKLLTMLVIRKIQFEMARCHFTSIRLANIEKFALTLEVQ